MEFSAGLKQGAVGDCGPEAGLKPLVRLKFGLYLTQERFPYRARMAKNAYRYIRIPEIVSLLIDLFVRTDIGPGVTASRYCRADERVR
jgi:hypothetical protein